eukprot:2813234-Rhodomonas_salina.1
MPGFGEPAAAAGGFGDGGGMMGFGDATPTDAMAGFGGEATPTGGQGGGMGFGDGMGGEEEGLVGADGAVYTGMTEEKARAKFDSYDTDGSGALDSDEVVKLSVDLFRAFNHGKELTVEQVPFHTSRHAFSFCGLRLFRVGLVLLKPTVWGKMTAVECRLRVFDAVPFCRGVG